MTTGQDLKASTVGNYNPNTIFFMDKYIHDFFSTEITQGKLILNKLLIDVLNPNEILLPDKFYISQITQEWTNPQMQAMQMNIFITYVTAEVINNRENYSITKVNVNEVTTPINFNSSKIYLGYFRFPGQMDFYLFLDKI
jgi:hypothetical protein